MALSGWRCREYLVSATRYLSALMLVVAAQACGREPVGEPRQLPAGAADRTDTASPGDRTAGAGTPGRTAAPNAPAATPDTAPPEPPPALLDQPVRLKSVTPEYRTFPDAAYGDPCHKELLSIYYASGCGDRHEARATCIRGALAITLSDDPSCAAEPSAASWSEPRCAEAARAGASGHACSGGSWACVVRRADPSCVTVARCAGRLQLNTICIAAETRVPRLPAPGRSWADCAAAIRGARPGDACSGSWACSAGTMLAWCSDGLLALAFDLELPWE